MIARAWNARIALVLALAPALAALPGCTSARPIEVIRESGDNRMRGGNYEQARDEYAEIASRQPGDWEAQYKLGLCMIQTKEYSGARRALEIANAHQSDNQDVANALAEAIFLQGDENRLFAFLRERATRTQTVAAHLQLAKYAMALNDPDTAQVAVNTAIEIDGAKTTEPYLAASQLAERLGHMDEAVNYLRQGLGINPYDSRVRDRLRQLGENLDTVSPLPPGRPGA